jgi:hypothetical protein
VIILVDSYVLTYLIFKSLMVKYSQESKREFGQLGLVQMLGLDFGL